MNSSPSEQDIIALLPWYVNGTLDNAERQQVEQWLEKSGVVRDELDTLNVLRQYLRDDHVEFPAASLSWKRLQKQIRQTKTGDHNHRSSAWWSKAAAIAAVLVIVIQVGWLSLSHMTSPQPDVRLLGDMPAVAAERQAIIQLRLSENMPWQDVVTLLSGLNADIVQGPTALGIVRLRVSLNRAVINNAPAADINAVLLWLQVQPGVEHVALER